MRYTPPSPGMVALVAASESRRVEALPKDWRRLRSQREERSWLAREGKKESEFEPRAMVMKVVPCADGPALGPRLGPMMSVQLVFVLLLALAVLCS